MIRIMKRVISRIAIMDLYYGKSGKLGFYNSQAVGLAKAYSEKGYEVFIVRPEKNISEIVEQELENKIRLLNVPARVLGVHSFYDLKFLLNYKIDLVRLALRVHRRYLRRNEGRLIDGCVRRACRRVELNSTRYEYIYFYTTLDVIA